MVLGSTGDAAIEVGVIEGAVGFEVAESLLGVGVFGVVAELGGAEVIVGGFKVIV